MRLTREDIRLLVEDGHIEQCQSYLRDHFTRKERSECLWEARQTDDALSAQALVRARADFRLEDLCKSISPSMLDVLRQWRGCICLDHPFNVRELKFPEWGFNVLKWDPHDKATSYPLLHPSFRAGRSNPEDLTHPAWVHAVVHQIDAFTYRMESEKGWRKFLPKAPAPLNCQFRRGQVLAFLGDQLLLIAGAYTDAYAPYASLYNDVTVIGKDGSIRIFGYPFDLFPPACDHAATLVGDWIYLVGGVEEDFVEGAPVKTLRLHTSDYHIEPVPTTGEVPPNRCHHEIWAESEGLVLNGKHMLNLDTFAWQPKH